MEQSNFRHPVEDIEPDDSADIYRQAYRESSKVCLRVLNRAILTIVTARRPKVAAWQVAYGLGLAVCEGVSVTKRARMIGVTRAYLSKGAKLFQRSNNLPPSPYMKSDESVGAFADAREEQLK